MLTAYLCSDNGRVGKWALILVGSPTIVIVFSISFLWPFSLTMSVMLSLQWRGTCRDKSSYASTNVQVMDGTSDGWYKWWMVQVMDGTSDGWCKWWMVQVMDGASDGWYKWWMVQVMHGTSDGWYKWWMVQVMDGTSDGWYNKHFSPVLW